jgi:2-polyprenyl-6-methoxyphenol hydroxylase-like FAD-dependent oxidoreductase
VDALRTLVVGAGVAGLATARALSLAGFEVEVVERQPRWRHPGAGMYLPGNTTRALGGLGLAEALRERAVEITRQRFRDHHGRLLCEVDLTRLWGRVGPCLALPRTELHEVLRAGAGGTVRMGVTTTAISLERPGKVAVAFSDGGGGDYDLVVGADGIGSTVRRLAFGDAAVRPVGQVGWRFVVPCPPQVTDWSVLLGRRAAFLTLPIGSGRAYCYADVVASPDAVEGEPVPDEAGRLRALFASFAEPVPTILGALDHSAAIHSSVIEEVAVASWVRGRVVLVGDAAHATSPNMAEGAGMAVEDALVLAESLVVEPAVPAALARFEARRRPRTDWVRAQTHRRDHTRYLHPTVGHTALRVLGRRIVHGNYRPLKAAI